MKIIFLDIDGVLNSEEWYKRRAGIYSHKQIDENYPVLEIDPHSIRLLNKIIIGTNANIVISSSWRHNNTIVSINKLLEVVGFKGIIIDFTPDLGYSYPRGCEIKEWIKNTDIDVDNYVILDDDIDMLYYQRNNFIVINERYGITEGDVNRAIEILNKL